VYDPATRNTAPLPAFPAELGKFNETVTVSFGATFGIVGSGVIALAAPRTALEMAGLAVMLPRFVTVMTATYCPFAFVDSDCSVDEI
jgi:hypothetical protein